MARRIWGGLLAVAASAAGLGLAVAVGSAGADNRAATTTTTLGSTTGTPNQNICLATFDCTYVPFSSAANPTLQVPLNGSVTSFSVNSGSGTGSVQLRVLRPAGSGNFTGVGTSPAEPLSSGGNTFSVSLPVHAGDVLALDNSTSALLFDTSSLNPVFTAYYQPSSSGPSGLPDGSTASPNNNKMGYRLLLSAVVTGTAPTTTTTANGTSVTTTVSGGTTTVVKTVQPRPVIGNPTQSRPRWRLSQGTTFAFGLGTSAKVKFTFRQRVGRHSTVKGARSLNGHPGTNRLAFNGKLSNGKRLKKGRYTVTITATNQAGGSKPASLSFTITG
jgi:hypothetical protein